MNTVSTSRKDAVYGALTNHAHSVTDTLGMPRNPWPAWIGIRTLAELRLYAAQCGGSGMGVDHGIAPEVFNRR
jgi:hypothetical protein